MAAIEEDDIMVEIRFPLDHPAFGVKSPLITRAVSETELAFLYFSMQMLTEITFLVKRSDTQTVPGRE